MIQRFRNIRASTVLKALIVPVVVIAATVGVDQLVKYLVRAYMELGEQIVLVPKFLSFDYVTNDGAAFGSLSGGRTLFLILTAIAMPAVFVWLVWHFDDHPLNKLALSLVIGGGIGNFIDRAAFGVVTDMFRIDYFGGKLFGSEYFPIFNVADIALTVGCVLLLVFYMFVYYDKKDPKAVEAHDKKVADKRERRARKQRERDAKGVESVEQYLARVGAEGVGSDTAAASGADGPEASDGGEGGV